MATTRQQGSLFTNIHNGIATIEFGHPASNSFPRELLERLTKEITTISKNKAVQVIVLQSEGDGAFCAGASFDELIAVSSLEEGTLFFSGFANLINAMRCCSQLIVGKVHGKAVGGGVGIIAACDYVLASEKAAIKLSELTIGIGPFVIAPAVQRKVGVAGLAELSLDATRWKSAYWAKEKGLYASVYDTVKALNTAVDELANRLASYNPDALVAMKKTLWKDTEHWKELLIKNAAISGELVLSEFTKNALAKFSKK